MKTKLILSLAIAITAALVTQPMFAAPITYLYTGNPFTFASGPYTTSDRVLATVTLASPLGTNMPYTAVSPFAFSLSDGVQNITSANASFSEFFFGTGSTGLITSWFVLAETASGADEIETSASAFGGIGDTGAMGGVFGFNSVSAGTWSSAVAPEGGYSLALLSLSLTALGVAARPFKRAVA